MSTTAANHDADILARVIAPGTPELTRQTAEMLLTLDFPPEDRERMNHLAAKAGDGELTDDEQREIDAYERVGHILSLLKSKARMWLDSSRDSE
ncbi:MAG: hypothetical protein BMS9Abin37_0261 [Acidobacteriota bacterium]|nr:MAG: hypothetical protein BMS9Abin37_0261 [Acidobacteriota bacterium]